MQSHHATKEKQECSQLWNQYYIWSVTSSRQRNTEMRHLSPSLQDVRQCSLCEGCFRTAPATADHTCGRESRRRGSVPQYHYITTYKTSTHTPSYTIRSRWPLRIPSCLPLTRWWILRSCACAEASIQMTECVYTRDAGMTSSRDT